MIADRRLTEIRKKHREGSLGYAVPSNGEWAKMVGELLAEHDLLQGERSVLAAKVNSLAARVDDLQRFKDWVHNCLTEHGVPEHPGGPHTAAGCRIGDRLDWVFARLENQEADTEALRREVVETENESAA